MRSVDKTRLGAACVLPLVMMLHACAAPAQSGRMLARLNGSAPTDRSSPFHQAIQIKAVGGGEETNPILVSKVGDKELAGALRESLREYGLLAGPDVQAPYVLEAFLIDLKQPVSGLAMIVDSFIRYKLSRNGDGKVVYDDIVIASYRATMKDSIYGVTRLRIANEGSIRANIEKFLAALSSLAPPNDSSP